MSNHKLSVLQREPSQSGYHRSLPYTNNEISQIKVFDSRNDQSLNAIPSPLARMHLLDAAFQLVYSDMTLHTNYSGHAYKKLVSDWLDVFELLYNWNHHLLERKKLSILAWNKEESITRLQARHRQKIKEIAEHSGLPQEFSKAVNMHELDGFKPALVGKTINLYLNQEEFKDYNIWHILKLDRTVIAGTSPLTGFFTSPNDLSNLDLINPFTKRKYFDQRPRLFPQRDPKVQQYVQDFFAVPVFNSELAVKKYLSHSSNTIATRPSLKLVPVSPPVRILNDAIELKTSSDRNDYFEKYLVRLNYTINEKHYVVLDIPDGNRKYDYLLPLTPTYFRDFGTEDIDKRVTITEMSENQVRVSIEKQKGEVISKVYDTNKETEDSVNGRIVRLQEQEKLNFSLSIFPALIVEGQPELNNLYKVMLGTGTSDSRFESRNIRLSFYACTKNKDLREIEEIIPSRYDRTELRGNFLGSTYFGLQQPFDFIRLQIDGGFGITGFECSIVPRWIRKPALGKKKFRYAIDFGTTTTFVGYRDMGTKLAPLPFSIETEKELLVAPFHKPAQAASKDRSPTGWDYEEFSAFDQFNAIVLKEFMPVVIGSAVQSRYRFPIRTALCEVNHSAGALEALSNANIAFGYEKISMTDEHQDFVPNLKWSLEEENENRIKVFLTQLAQMIKYKIILNDGDPGAADIVWFYPLSFGGRNLELYKKIWKDLFNKVFKSAGNLVQLTESEAPFYYHKINATFDDFENVLSIDIGGGSTDIVYFEDGNPKFGSSFNYAAGLLWSDGNIGSNNKRENGIYKYFEGKIGEGLQHMKQRMPDAVKRLEYEKVEALNNHYQSKDKYGSEEVINFWLSHDANTAFTGLLNKSPFRLNFLFFFSSIIYHSAQLLMARGAKRPTSICISGNGSRVIDLISMDHKRLERIVRYLIDAAFESADHKYMPQVILPIKDERKEATCFGGLYKDENSGSPLKVTHPGVSNADLHRFKDVSTYSEITLEFLEGVKANVKAFIKVFHNMNAHINFKEELGLEVPLHALEAYLVDNVDKNFKYQFDKKKRLFAPQDQISDSPFFWALKGLLFDLSNLNEEKLQPYRQRTAYYFERPAIDGSFQIQEGRTEKSEMSMYKIEVEGGAADTGIVSFLVDSEYAVKVSRSNPELYLLPVCKYAVPDGPTSSIRIIAPGTVIREQDKWVVDQKMHIEFI